MRSTFVHTFSLLFLLLPLLLAGCGADESEPKVVPPIEKKLAFAPPAPAATNQNGLQLRPAQPTVTDTLVAVVKDSRPGSFHWFANGVPVDGESNKALDLRRFRRGDEISCRFEGDGAPLSNSTVIGNSLPKVVATAFADPYVHHGVDIEIITDTEDADGDRVSLSYRWFINDQEVSGQKESLLPGDLFRKGDRVAVWIVPADNDGEGEVFYGKEFTVPDAPPEFTSSPPTSFEAQEYSYVAQAQDPDGDKLHYSLDAAPAGMEIGEWSGELRWRIDPAAGTTQQVRIVASDPDGLTAVQEYTLNLAF